MLKKEELPQKDLQRILAQYDLGEVIKTEPILSSGNISYLIETERGRYFLRICPDGPRFRSKEEIAAELELIEHLLKNNFPAPLPVAQKNGQIIIHYQRKYGYLRKYDEGDSLSAPNLVEVKKFGQALGWFHSLTDGYETKNKRKHFFDPKETKNYFNVNKGKILKSKFKNAHEFVARVEEQLAKLNFPENLPNGMIHEDLGRRHVLWKNGEIAMFIDFDRSYFGNLILDLGQAARGWCFIKDWYTWSNENVKALLSGYQSKRKLSTLEKQCFVDAVKFGVLERSIAFCLRFIEVTNDPEDEEYSYKSAFDLIDLLEKNRGEINKILDQ